MSKVTRWLALSVLCAALIGVAATAATARTTIISVTTDATPPLQSAIYDPIFQTSQRNQAFAMASQAGATWARIDVSWRATAPLTLPSPSSLFHPTDPNSPYYKWSTLDASISSALAHGIQPELDIVATPSWAYHVQPGKWAGGQPNIGALGDFATALAKRYNGKVHAYSVWNEPNFNRNLSPQDPVWYRGMVNAVADAVHAVNPTNLALGGELAPFKHAKTKSDPNNVIPPITWMQQMLCVSPTKQRTCDPGSVHMDVWTHHPYSDTGPFGHAKVSGGVELGDLPKMNSLLQTAWSLGTISSSLDDPGQPFPFWVTEIGWSSNPPNKHGAPMKLETRWVAEAYYQLWKSGATLGTWFLLQDQPTTTPLQSGLYTNTPTLSTAVAKPLLTPFEFPFVAYLKSGGKVLVWGRDTTSDVQTVEIDMKVSGKWKHVADVTSNSYGIFTATLPVHAKSTYSMRASAPGSGTSTAFTLKPPSNENLRVVPFPMN